MVNSFDATLNNHDSVEIRLTSSVPLIIGEHKAKLINLGRGSTLAARAPWAGEKTSAHSVEAHGVGGSPTARSLGHTI